jgi:hypothetical protein
MKLTVILAWAIALISWITPIKANGQDNGLRPESEIVVSKRYVDACQKNLKAVEDASRWLDVSEGQVKECRARGDKDAKRIEALVRENERMTAAIKEAPNRWVWFGAGAGSVLVGLLVVVLIR